MTTKQTTKTIAKAFNVPKANVHVKAIKPDNSKMKAEAKSIAASALAIAKEREAAKTKKTTVSVESKAQKSEAKAEAAKLEIQAREAAAVKRFEAKALKAEAKALADSLKVPKGPTIGAQTIGLILNTPMTNLEILAEIQKNNVGCKTSYACVAWYRSKLRNEGKLAPRYVKSA